MATLYNFNNLSFYELITKRFAVLALEYVFMAGLEKTRFFFSKKKPNHWGFLIKPRFYWVLWVFWVFRKETKNQKVLHGDS